MLRKIETYPIVIDRQQGGVSVLSKSLSMSNKARIALILVTALVFITTITFAGPIDDCKEYSRLGIPGGQGKLLCRKGFLLAYSSKYKTPLWVIEHLTAEKAQGNLPIYNKFQTDPDLKEGERAELDDYKDSGYDREQMASAANMKWDQQAMMECFYLSNMVPHKDKRTNLELEERIRNLAINRGALYIFAGPIYEDGVLKTIGRNKVAVPTHLYKIIYDPYKVEAIAFIMPNEKANMADMAKYIVTIRDVERKTGLNFLSNIDEQVQEVVKNRKVQGIW